jgi:glycosyltransferase involved in cell wall biosynthesis
MRVMIVSACFPPNGWGGAEVAAEGIASWLSEQGHQVAVYTDAVLGAAPAANGHTPHEWHAPAKAEWLHRAHEHGKQNGVRKALWHAIDHSPYQGESEFARAATSFRPDVVMVHLAPGLGLGLFEHCAAKDLPVLFVVHDFWMTCLRSSMFSKGGSVCKEREWLCRLSSTRRLAALSKIPRLGFWAPSARIVEIIRSEVGDVFRNVLIERNVVNLSDFEKPVPASSSGPVRFLYVGKVTAAKGVRFVLECLASLPAETPFEVDIVGNGDLEEPLKQQFAADARFRFRGVRQRAEIASLYQGASVLLVPSLWFENSPLVIYQAQASGLPVVASDSGGIPELLNGRSDSFILPAGDAQAWAAQLRAIATQPALLAGLKTSARQYARDSGKTLDARGRKVEALCRTLIEQRR